MFDMTPMRGVHRVRGETLAVEGINYEYIIYSAISRWADNWGPVTQVLKLGDSIIVKRGGRPVAEVRVYNIEEEHWDH